MDTVSEEAVDNGLAWAGSVRPQDTLFVHCACDQLILCLVPRACRHWLEPKQMSRRKRT